MSKNRYAIGVDLGGTNLRAAAVDSTGKILGFLKIPTEVPRGKDRVIANLLRLVKRIRNRLPKKQLAGVGAGVPGAILFEKGVVTRSPNFPDWKNVSLKKELGGELDVPFFVDNDANMAAIGEYWQGAARGKKNFCMVTLGTGIGGGLFLGGRIFRGENGMAGEIGHITVHPDGARCGCGNTGCWELYASAGGLVRLARELRNSHIEKPPARRPNPDFLPSRITPENLGEGADRGDPFSREVFQKYGQYLGIGIADVGNVLNIHTFVIGGGITGSWEHFEDSAVREIQRRAYVFSRSKVDLRKSVLGDEAGILGSAFTVFENVDPLPKRKNRP